MASPSTMGRPAMDAGMIGSRELLPPISFEIRAVALLAHVVFKRAEGVVGLDVPHLLDANRWRSDAADTNDAGVFIQLLRG